jgi:hypothetical protein
MKTLDKFVGTAGKLGLQVSWDDCGAELSESMYILRKSE